jgi:uncharacterized protein with ATP-grasp and redox domains
MKVYIDCVHCYLKQAVSCMTVANIDEDKQHEVLYKLMDYIKELDRNETPAANSTKVVLKTYELIGTDDPYKDVKKESNDIALKYYPKLKAMLNKSNDRLYDALKIAVAGNVIDLGINRDFDIDAALEQSMKIGFTKDNYDVFREKLNKVDEILFLGDNAGEIVFDKILIEELVSMDKKVTYVVKEAPVLNDSTMEDVKYVGMDKVANVITTGSNYLGLSFEHSSPEFLEVLNNAKLVISKGQANFESLEDRFVGEQKVFFLLKLKCEGVARVGCANFGDVVFFTK